MSYPTQAEVRAGLDAYNRFVARIWSSKQSEIVARANKAAQELMNEEDRVKEIQSLELDLKNPPTLAFEGTLDGPGRLKVVFRLPGDESWSFQIRGRYVVGFPFSGKGNTIEVKVKRLRVSAELELDRTSPVEASFVDTKVSVDLDGVKIRSTNFLLNLFAGFLSLVLSLVERVVERMARDALAESLPDAEAVRAVAALGLASEPVTVSGADLAALEESARAVSTRVAERHMPFDTVLNTLVPRDDPGGEAAGYKQFEDSAIWTGHLLAGEVFRAQSGDAGALVNVRKALNGLDSLIRLAGEEGLLSRVQVPSTEEAIVEALDAERQEAGHGERLFTSVDGKYRSIGHITRDQYAGACLGTGLAAALLDDAELRDKARGIFLAMASYLVDREFCPTEATADPVTKTKLTSVTYVANPNQVLAILQAAKAHDPERFTEAFDDLFPIWSIQWLFVWIPALEPHDSYFKFNLEHASALLLLLLEDDSDRRARLALGLRALRARLRYHAEAWFNLVELAAIDNDEDLSRPRQEIEAETRYLIAEAFKRPPFILTSDLAEDPSIVKEVYHGASGDDDETIAKMPVDVVRRPGADFLWQRSPFSLEVVWSVPDDPAMRSPNVDLILPYWLARRLGL